MLPLTFLSDITFVYLQSPKTIHIPNLTKQELFKGGTFAILVSELTIRKMSNENRTEGMKFNNKSLCRHYL